MQVTHWTVLTIAFLIAIVSILAGKWSRTTLLGLVALVLLGALFPPLGALIGGAALLRLFFVANGGGQAAGILALNSNLSDSWSKSKSALTGQQPKGQ